VHGLTHAQRMTTNGGNGRVDRVYYGHATTTVLIIFIDHHWFIQFHSFSHQCFRSWRSTFPQHHITFCPSPLASLAFLVSETRPPSLWRSINGDRVLITSGYFVDRQWGWGTSYWDEWETIQNQGRNTRTLDSLAFLLFFSW